MIEVTKINASGRKFSVNAFLIQTLDDGVSGQTVIKMQNGEKIIVSESRKEIEEKFYNLIKNSFSGGVLKNGR